MTDVDSERQKLELLTGEVGKAKRMIMSQIPVLREAQMLTARLNMLIMANPYLMVLLSAIQLGAMTWGEFQALAQQKEAQMKQTQDMLDRMRSEP
jgi:hypothetical protein